MRWTWPLRSPVFLLPDEPGQFGVVRKEDVHTGDDLYCELGTEVVAVEDGEVILVEGFTGPNAADPSPWWNDTDAILVRGASGVVVYGEVSARVRVGDTVKAGQVIGVVERAVLKSFKGRPMVMLHLELMDASATGTVWWKLGEEMPSVLRDPTPYLLDAAGGAAQVFDLSAYDGQAYRDPSAPSAPSRWWGVWGGSGPLTSSVGETCETSSATRSPRVATSSAPWKG